MVYNFQVTLVLHIGDAVHTYKIHTANNYEQNILPINILSN